jgi:hypothetical protein
MTTIQGRSVVLSVLVARHSRMRRSSDGSQDCTNRSARSMNGPNSDGASSAYSCSIALMPPDDRHCMVIQRPVVREWFAQRRGSLDRDVGEVGSRRVDGGKPLRPHGAGHTTLPRNEVIRQRAFSARQRRIGNSRHRPRHPKFIGEPTPPSVRPRSRSESSRTLSLNSRRRRFAALPDRCLTRCRTRG